MSNSDLAGRVSIETEAIDLTDVVSITNSQPLKLLPVVSDTE